MNLKKKTSVFNYLYDSGFLTPIIVCLAIVATILFPIIGASIFKLSTLTIIVTLSILWVSGFVTLFLINFFEIYTTIITWAIIISFLGLSFIAGKVTYKFYPELIKNMDIVKNHLGDITNGDIFFVGMLEVILIVASLLLIYFSGLLLHLFLVEVLFKEFLIPLIYSMKLYKKATYIPITKEELKENGILTQEELGKFFVNELFKDVKRSYYLNLFPIKDSVIESFKNVLELMNLNLSEDDIKRVSENLYIYLEHYLESDDDMNTYLSNIKNSIRKTK